jgi:hypothetical protein
MIPEFRKEYNSQFTNQKYNDFLNDLNSEFGYNIDFRIAETPIFLNKELVNELINAGNSIVEYLQSQDFRLHSKTAIPKGMEVPSANNGEDEHAKVIAIDFAICLDELDEGEGKLIPQLIELQGFPSLYFYQELLSIKYKKHFHIQQNYTNFFNGLEHNSYIESLKDLIVGDSNPENVILLEIAPEKQKTRIDFSCTEKWIGVKPVCVTKIIKEGKKLFYKCDGKNIPIQRIYNRVIFDELSKRKDLKLNFSFQDELDVDWIPHPNWFFKISKHTLPGLKNRYVPYSIFLNKLDIPEDLENYVLKPLYSFAGSGVKYDVTSKDIDSIKDKRNFILQKKINYAPIIETPDIHAKAEIRLLYIWDKEPMLVNNIVRLSKGKMMGVDFNKDKSWVGSSIAYFESFI